MNSAAGGDLDLELRRCRQQRGEVRVRSQISVWDGAELRRRGTPGEVDRRETSGLYAAVIFRGRGLPVLLSRETVIKR